jgi:hypothetical protein
MHSARVVEAVFVGVEDRAPPAIGAEYQTDLLMEIFMS